MSARTVLFAQLLVLFALACLHIFGLIHFLYWQYRWLDIIAHLLGGVWIGFNVLWIGAVRSKTSPVLFCAAAGLGIGMLWEVFEAYFGITSFPIDAFDTTKDLVMDMLGSAAVGFFNSSIPRVKQKR